MEGARVKERCDGSMTSKGEVYEKGDWLVHPSYGIGQVKKIEKKKIEGRKTEFYRVEGENVTYWLPVGELEASRVRRLASKKEFRKSFARQSNF
jgi:RNA polymerase-interacting CarD/CdnL/TRCF family regulator